MRPPIPQSRLVSSYAVALAAIFLAGWLATTTAEATPFTEEVFCGDQLCGVMTIDTYDTSTGNLDSESKYWLGGAHINGDFQEIKHGKYHYIQSITSNTDSFRWINDTANPLPNPWLDTPPGGYAVRDGAGDPNFNNQAFDYKPWYDEGNEFPNFFDRPRDYMLQAKTLPGNKLEWLFETWLVCTIFEDSDGDNEAKDDSYIVAPLLGWQWGYEISYEDALNLGVDDIEDFTLSLKEFKFIGTPSDDWLLAISSATKYGADPNQDYFSVELDDCVKCISEPAALGILGLGLFSIALANRRRTRLAV
ncbi:MAG: hypothetical protein H3C28_02870 [Sphingomonadales bacterium]|nr:hypothetical protein [Sphingomonadales bacterium]